MDPDQTLTVEVSAVNTPIWLISVGVGWVAYRIVSKATYKALENIAPK